MLDYTHRVVVRVFRKLLCGFPQFSSPNYAEYIYAQLLIKLALLIGNLSVRLEFNVDSDLNGASPQYTLTCISTGGPATNVSWARYYVTVTNGTESVLVDPVTARYNHTMTVTRRIGGYYICSVSNSKPSNVWVGYEVIGI